MDLKDKIVLRTLTTIKELTAINELVKIIWGRDDVIPIHQTLTALKNGGLVLGAYLENKLIGFQYSFAGFNGQQPYLCSHMLGIHPDYQHLGIGEKLKLRQREEALKIGYTLITWTYDPLESVNGYFNIRKLGAVCYTYIENCYGEMEDNLNCGLPSDRFLVKWWLTSDHVMKRINKTGTKDIPDKLRMVVDCEQINNSFPVIKKIDLNTGDGDTLFVAIPSNFQEIKKSNFSLAVDWRIQTRMIFQKYFTDGWVITDFFKNSNSLPVHYYVLKKNFIIS